jgi:decaprenylphospho-beta-D-ribofuranose 2-oxidase
MSTELLTGWGRTAPTRPARLARPTSEDELRNAFYASAERGVIARGLGRSYGDAAQNGGGDVIDLTALDSVFDLDAAAGQVTVAAGVSLGALLELLLPAGWFIRVSPGTRFVTVGGAIGCDIHGKNHHVDGAFCRHVLSFDLLTPADEIVTVTPSSRPDVFWATAGGMGLTGIVLRATLALEPVETARMLVDVERAANLDDALASLDARDAEYQYSVAWIDCLAAGKSLGRSVLQRANHAALVDLPPSARGPALDLPRRPRLRVPPWVPPHLVNGWSIRAFNEVYFRAAPKDRRGVLKPLDSFFYPLDGVADWNRLYGAQGFVQYQFVVPFGAEETLRAALERLSRAGCASFLAVLKRFGAEQGLLSFPMPGWTLALDIPASSRSVGPVLDGIDELVAQAGGRVYLAKDARLRPELLEVMYPRLPEWREIQARLDPGEKMQSDLARRLRLTAGAR